MSEEINRRSLLKNALATSVAVPLVRSLEEHRLLAYGSNQESSSPNTSASSKMPQGTIGKVKMSRIICGGNLISGYAHSRDLIYVSQLLKNYFTDEKIMETWALCEQQGINTMIFNPSDKHAVAVYQAYRKRGGKIQYLAQIDADKNDLQTPVKQAADSGASGILLVGNLGDAWTRSGDVEAIGDLVLLIKQQGLIAGVAGHELRTPMMVEKAGIEPDFYMKTLHHKNYWSHQQPGQDKEVIDNYNIDNYWCREPDETIAFMRQLKRPWMAYKVLAAGAVHPRQGFRYAFENGADFAVVGMFDFQVGETSALAREILTATTSRQRPWMA
jgi:hypothetical protein